MGVPLMWLNQNKAEAAATLSVWFLCVCVFFFFGRVGEVVTGFYRFHLCQSLLAMCESSGQI